MKNKCVLPVTLWWLALTPAVAPAYVLVSGASPDPYAETPTARRIELEMEGLKIAQVQQDFASGQGPTPAQLKVGRDWFCFAVNVPYTLSYSNKQYEERPQAISIRISEGTSGNWPSFLAIYSSRYGLDIDYSRSLRSDSIIPGAELTMSASRSYRGTYGNEYYIAASVSVRSAPEGPGLRLHYVGDYQETFNGRPMAQHSVEGYATCPWTLRH